jgi:hypothetical protein
VQCLTTKDGGLKKEWRARSGEREFEKLIASHVVMSPISASCRGKARFIPGIATWVRLSSAPESHVTEDIGKTDLTAMLLTDVTSGAPIDESFPFTCSPILWQLHSTY